MPSIRARLDQLDNATGIAQAGGPDQATGPFVSLPEQIYAANSMLAELITNVPGFLVLAGSKQAMRNDNLLRSLQATQLEMGQVKTQLKAMSDAVALDATNYELNFALLNSQRQLDLAGYQLLAQQNELQDEKDELQDAVMQQLAAQQLATQQQLDLVQAQTALNTTSISLVASRATALELRATASEAEALRNRLADERDAAQTALNTADIEHQRLQQLADETKIEADRVAAAQALTVAQAALARAEQAGQAAAAADTKATNAGNAAATAQAKADLDEQNITKLNGQVASLQTSLTATNQNLATQTSRVDGTVASIAALQTSVAAAKTTADNAQAAVTALEKKGRVVLGVAFPQITLLGGQSQNVAVTFAAMADVNYAESVIQVSGGATAVQYSVVPGSKTVSGFTLTRTNTGTLSLVVPAATVDIIVSR